jgi:hypothetical protein
MGIVRNEVEDKWNNGFRIATTPIPLFLYSLIPLPLFC